MNASLTCGGPGCQYLGRTAELAAGLIPPLAPPVVEEARWVLKAMADGLLDVSSCFETLASNCVAKGQDVPQSRNESCTYSSMASGTDRAVTVAHKYSWTNNYFQRGENAYKTKKFL